MPESVLVLGNGCQAFLAIIRSLGRRGLEVHVASPDLNTPALASRYIAGAHDLPQYSSSGEKWADALRQLIATHDYRLVIPSSDETLLTLYHHVIVLGEDRVATPNRNALQSFTYKPSTRALAERVGTPICAGKIVSLEDDPDALVREFGLPLALKPPSTYVLGGAARNAVRIIREVSALREALSGCAAEGFLVESFFRGVGVGVSVLANRGEVVQAYQHRRLRESSDAGLGTFRVSEPVDERLLASVTPLARATGLHGVAMFEFRYDPATGAHVLLEVNPRFWGSLPLAVAAGADFPGMLYDLLVTGAARPMQYRTGIQLADMEGEYFRAVRKVEAAASLHARLAAVSSMMLTAARPYLRRDYDSWAGDDEGPFLQERRELLSHVGSAIGRRLFPHRREEQAIDLPRA